jgi:flagellar hook-basal body complex protein FliE
MTSISAISSSNYQSPLQKLQDELQAEISSGTIGSSDQDALSSALTDIDSSLQSSRASDSAGGTRPSPGDLKSKIDDLIAGEVSSGKLTSDQATELQGVFKAAFANGPGGPGGPGGPHGGHGGPPPADGASSSDSASSSSGASSAADILQQFLQSLQEQLSASSSTSYSATGSSSTARNASSSFSALLIDYQT